MAVVKSIACVVTTTVNPSRPLWSARSHRNAPSVCFPKGFTFGVASLASGSCKSVWSVRPRRKRFLCLSAAIKKLAEVEAVDISKDLTKVPASPGIYAIYDKAGVLQFVGLSRRISASLQVHVEDLPEYCCSAKIAVVDAPDRSALTDVWKQWMEEHVNSTGQVPPGNVQGVTTWITRKPKAAVKPEIRLTPGPNVKLNVSLEDLIDKVVKDCSVVAFIKGTRTAPQCGFSHRVLTILNEQGIDYETVNVLDEHYNPGLRDAIKNYSKWPTIPQVYVKGEFLGGADILDEMVQNGEIKTILRK